MDAAERKDILSRYLDHARRFDEAAARRSSQEQDAEVIPLTPPLRELEQEPTMREIEVLQLISDGLVNREIGVRLYLSEETVKSHVRHLLAKLQARSRAHLTTTAAGEIARAAGARRVEPFHFSPRYEGEEEVMIAEVMDAFEKAEEMAPALEDAGAEA